MKINNISKTLAVALSLTLSIQQVSGQGQQSRESPIPTLASSLPSAPSEIPSLSLFTTDSPSPVSTIGAAVTSTTPEASLSASSTPESRAPASSTTRTSESPKGPCIPTKVIIAASVGGGVGFLLICGLAIFMLHRQRRKLNIPHSMRKPSLNIFGSRGGNSRGGPYVEMGYESTSHLPIYNQFATMRNGPASGAHTPIYSEFAAVRGPPGSYSPEGLDRRDNSDMVNQSSRSRLAVPSVGMAI